MKMCFYVGKAKMNSYFNKMFQPTLRSPGDILVGLLLGVVFVFLSFEGAKLMPTAVFQKSARDVWFQTASDSVYALLGDKEHPKHGRNNIHPFFSIICHPVVNVLRRLPGVDFLTALHILIATTAFIWGFILYVVLRLMNCKPFDAVLFNLLAMVSASSMFWFVVPETFALGSVSILAALGVVLISQQFSLSYAWYFGINLLTFSFSSTNWMAGILVTLVNHKFKDALQLCANVFCVATVLWGIQKLIYPASKFFLDVSGEMDFVNRVEAGGPLQVVKAFFCHTLVMPSIYLIENPNDSLQWPDIMSVQLSGPGSASLFGLIGVILWTVLLMIGMGALFSLKDHFKFRLVLGLLLLGQLGLHSFYGEETFLYSLHFVVLLIPLVALGSLTRLRIFVMAMVVVLIPCVALNNVKQFREATSIFQRFEASARAGDSNGKN